jgi:sorbitol-specific phosphotransferase system component IIA
MLEITAVTMHAQIQILGIDHLSPAFYGKSDHEFPGSLLS